MGPRARSVDFRPLAELLLLLDGDFVREIVDLSGARAERTRFVSELERRLRRSWIDEQKGRIVAQAVLARQTELSSAEGLVLERWVKPQAAYFTSAARRNDGRHRQIQRFGYGFFAVALALAFAKPFLSATNPLLVAVSLVPVVAALTNVWADRLALAPLAKQYGRMSHVFAAADAALDAAIKEGNGARGRAVVHETGEVNTLSVENLSADYELFIQDGDMVRGGRQDRLIAIDMLVPPRSGKVPLPAHCVESGRWTGRGDEDTKQFNKSDQFAVGNELRLANAAGLAPLLEPAQHCGEQRFSAGGRLSGADSELAGHRIEAAAPAKHVQHVHRVNPLVS